jgi:hypothetical protein
MRFIDGIDKWGASALAYHQKKGRSERLIFIQSSVQRFFSATGRHPPHAKAGGFTGMMGAERLQIVATVNALAGLRIVADYVLVVTALISTHNPNVSSNLSQISLIVG